MRKRSSTWTRSRATSRRCGGTSAAPLLMAVVKSDGYGHGMVPAARAALAGGASWLGVITVAEAPRTACGAGADGAGAVPDGRASARPTRRPSATRWTCPPGRWVWSRRSRRRRGRRAARPACTSRWTPGCRVAAPLPARGRAWLTRPWPPRRPGMSRSLGSCPTWPARTCPAIRRSTPRSRAFRDAVALAEKAGAKPEVRHLANTPATLTLPQTLVRPGADGRRRVRAVHAARRPTWLAAARDDGEGPADPGQAGGGGVRGCRTATGTSPPARARSGWCRWATPKASRADAFGAG